MQTQRVAVLGDVNFAHANALLAGVTRFTGARPNWEVIPLHYAQEGALSDLIGNGRIDGLIGAIVSDRWFRGVTHSAKIPVINTSSLSSITTLPSVLPHDVAIGALAAEHFVRRHYRSLAFAGIRSYACSGDRFDGFSAYAADHGIDASSLPHANMTSPLQEWRDLLLAIPKPLGLFCVDDHTARRAIALCRDSGMVIPDDISIIGVGNSMLDSFFAGIGISSVDIPFDAIGYEAASRLDRLLAGEPRDLEPLRIKPPGLTLRETTGTGALNTLVGRALNFIETNLASPLSVQDLVAHTGASRRLVELRFRETLDRSPHEEIIRLRMLKARRLLQETHTPISDVAAQCGYPEVSHFYARFKQHHEGTPPGAWRRQNTRN
jgi:LacI family transcriptional regulator